MFYLMNCVNFLNFSNNYNDNYSIVYSHIHTVHMTDFYINTFFSYVWYRKCQVAYSQE